MKKGAMNKGAMNKRWTIWMAFVAFIFVILLATAGKMAILYHLAQHFGLLEHSRHINPLGFILLMSIAFGTIAFALISKKTMGFLYDLKNATKRVAAGDFTVRLHATSRIKEIQAIIQDFNKMVVDLNGIQTLKDDFVTSVSHEIKTPLAGVEGCIALLKDDQLTPEERQEYLELIEVSVKRLSALTSNILRLSKLDNQAILSDLTTFSLDEQLRQAILILEHQWSGKDMAMQIYLSPVKVTANKELLVQVWINLLDNAIKFSDPGETIHVELSCIDQVAYVTITDFGMGMSPDTQWHIFQKFYQGSKSRDNLGNGLGLSIAKRIIELSGGQITVESQLGKGSKFVVEIPQIV